MPDLEVAGRPDPKIQIGRVAQPRADPAAGHPDQAAPDRAAGRRPNQVALQHLDDPRAAENEEDLRGGVGEVQGESGKEEGEEQETQDG